METDTLQSRLQFPNALLFQGKYEIQTNFLMENGVQ